MSFMCALSYWISSTSTSLPPSTTEQIGGTTGFPKGRRLLLRTYCDRRVVLASHPKLSLYNPDATVHWTRNSLLRLEREREREKGDRWEEEER
ncbi:hypothetical protein BX600DRAFT_450819 [Xylariales sp. PMI_506]|nr:hypothetical protein BX600DRAFT_450819 [Xylariales sp. PMI_506]